MTLTDRLYIKGFVKGFKETYIDDKEKVEKAIAKHLLKEGKDPEIINDYLDLGMKKIKDLYREIYYKEELETMSTNIIESNSEHLNSSIKRLVKKGLEEGALIKAKEIAIELLEDGVDMNLIAKYTKLSLEEIEEIKEQGYSGYLKLIQDSENTSKEDYLKLEDDIFNDMTVGEIYDNLVKRREEIE